MFAVKEAVFPPGTTGGKTLRQIDEFWFLLERAGRRPSACEARILHYITRMSNAVTGVCKASVGTIAAAGGYSESHTRAVIIGLASAGILEKTPRWDKLPNGKKPQLSNILRIIRGGEEERQAAAEREEQRRRVYAARKQKARLERAQVREKRDRPARRPSRRRYGRADRDAQAGIPALRWRPAMAAALVAGKAGLSPYY